MKQNLDEKQSNPRIERYLITRSRVKKSVGLVLGSAIIAAGYWIAQQPERLKLILESIQKGEFFSDIADVISSKFFPQPYEEAIIAGSANVVPNNIGQFFPESDVVFNELNAGVKAGTLMFLNVTNDVRPVRASTIQINGQNYPSYTRTLIDNKLPIAMLPFTQTAGSNYTLYTSFRDPDTGLVKNLSSLEKSEYRGGLVLYYENGNYNLKVASPSEFNSVDILNDDSVEAMAEFAFSFSSETIEEDLNVLQEYISPSGKDLSNVSDYSSIYATFQMPNGESKTEVVVSFQNYNSNTHKPINDGINLTVRQLIDLVRKRASELGSNKWDAVLPDPGENSGLLMPEGISPKTMYEEGNELSNIADKLGMNSGNRTVLDMMQELVYPNLGGFTGSIYSTSMRVPGYFLGYVSTTSTLDTNQLESELAKESDQNTSTDRVNIINNLKGYANENNSISIVDFTTGEDLLSNNDNLDMRYASAFKIAVLDYFLSETPSEVWANVPVEFWDIESSKAPGKYSDTLSRYGDILADVKHMIMYSDNDATGDVIAYVANLNGKSDNPINSFNSWAFNKGIVQTQTLLDRWDAGGTNGFSSSTDSSSVNQLSAQDFLAIYKDLFSKSDLVSVASELLKTPVADRVDLGKNLMGKGGYLAGDNSDYRIFSGLIVDDYGVPKYFIYLAGDYSGHDQDFDSALKLASHLR